MSAKLPGKIQITIDTYLEDNMSDLLWVADINYPNNASCRRVQAVGFPAFRFKLLSTDSKYAEFHPTAQRVLAEIAARPPAAVPGPADFQRAILEVFNEHLGNTWIEKEHLVLLAQDIIFERFLPASGKPHTHLAEFYAALDTPGFGNLRVVALEKLVADRRLLELKFVHSIAGPGARVLNLGKFGPQTGLVYLLGQEREQVIDLKSIDQ
jgi:hypothetical protein